MTIEYRPLTKILQFRLNRETENVRDDFFKSVIRTGLFIGKKEWMYVKDINDILCKEYSICELPKRTVERHLKQMVNNGEAVSKNGRYSLSKSGRKEHSDHNKEREKLEKSVFGKLLRHITRTYGNLSKSQEELVKKNFRKFLARYFTARGQDVAKVLTATPQKIESKDFIEILNKTLEEIEDDRLLGSQKNAICTLMSAPDSETAHFIFLTLQKYIYFEVMDFDPKCRVLERAALSHKKVILDTNVIFDLVFETEERHDLVEEMVKLSRQMNVEVVFTERTKEEFLKALSKAVERYHHWSNRVSEKTIRKMLCFESGVIKCFYKKKKDNPGLTFDGYVSSLERGFPRMLWQTHSIRYDPNIHTDPIDKEDLSAFRSLILTCAKNHLQFKDEDVIEHDAFHLSLIIYLRMNEEKSLLGAKHWFVTNDASLYCVSKALMQQRKISSPLSVRSDVWLEALSIFLPLSVIKDELKEIWSIFMKFCGAPFVPALPLIDRERLLKIAGPWMEPEWLTTDDIADIVSENFVNEYIHKPQDMEGSLSEVISPIVSRKIMDKMTRLENEREEIEQDRERTIREKAQLEARINEYEQKTKLVLFIPGVVCVISVVLLALIASNYKMDIPDVAFWCLTVMAILFIASSVFGMKIFERISVHFPAK